jgi:hypothetical protein
VFELVFVVFVTMLLLLVVIVVDDDELVTGAVVDVELHDEVGAEVVMLDVELEELVVMDELDEVPFPELEVDVKFVIPEVTLDKAVELTVDEAVVVVI